MSFESEGKTCKVTILANKTSIAMKIIFASGGDVFRCMSENYVKVSHKYCEKDCKKLKHLEGTLSSRLMYGYNNKIELVWYTTPRIGFHLYFIGMTLC